MCLMPYFSPRYNFTFILYNKKIRHQNGFCIFLNLFYKILTFLDIYNISKDILCNKNLLPIVEAWNNLKLSKLITIKSNSNRFKLLQARIKEVGIDKVIETINSINNSSFLKGQNNKGWVITFDWLIKPNNFIKVLEGNYLDKGGNEYGNNRVRSFGQNTGKSESQFQVKINTRNHKLTAEDEARAERELI